METPLGVGISAILLILFVLGFNWLTRKVMSKPKPFVKQWSVVDSPKGVGIVIAFHTIYYTDSKEGSTEVVIPNTYPKMSYYVREYHEEEIAVVYYSQFMDSHDVQKNQLTPIRMLTRKERKLFKKPGDAKLRHLLVERIEQMYSGKMQKERKETKKPEPLVSDTEFKEFLDKYYPLAK